MKYEIHFSIYGCENIIRFKELSQYTNWTYVMEKEFKEQFKILDLFNLERERRKQNDGSNL